MDGGRISSSLTFPKTAAALSGAANAGTAVKAAEAEAAQRKLRRDKASGGERAGKQDALPESKRNVQAGYGNDRTVITEQAGVQGGIDMIHGRPEPDRKTVKVSAGSRAGEAVDPKTTSENVNPGKEAPEWEQEKYEQVMARKAVENANQRVHSMGTSAKFEYNEDINRITITIADKASKDIIREIPPEATQKVLERIHMMTGMLMDTEV